MAKLKEEATQLEEEVTERTVDVARRHATLFSELRQINLDSSAALEQLSNDDDPALAPVKNLLKEYIDADAKLRLTQKEWQRKLALTDRLTRALARESREPSASARTSGRQSEMTPEILEFLAERDAQEQQIESPETQMARQEAQESLDLAIGSSTRHFKIPLSVEPVNLRIPDLHFPVSSRADQLKLKLVRDSLEEYLTRAEALLKLDRDEQAVLTLLEGIDGAFQQLSEYPETEWRVVALRRLADLRDEYSNMVGQLYDDAAFSAAKANDWDSVLDILSILTERAPWYSELHELVEMAETQLKPQANVRNVEYGARWQRCQEITSSLPPRTDAVSVAWGAEGTLSCPQEQYMRLYINDRAASVDVFVPVFTTDGRLQHSAPFAVSSDGKYLATLCDNSTIQVRGMVDGAVIGTSALPDTSRSRCVTAMGFAPDGRFLAAGGEIEGQGVFVHFFSPPTLEPLRTENIRSEVASEGMSLAFSPDMTRMAIIGKPDTSSIANSIADLFDGKSRPRPPNARLPDLGPHATVDDPPSFRGRQPDMSSLLRDISLTRFSTIEDSVYFNNGPVANDCPGNAGFSPDGRYLIVWSRDIAVLVNTVDSQPITKISFDEAIKGVVYSADASSVAFTHGNGAITIRTLPDLEMRSTFEDDRSKFRMSRFGATTSMFAALDESSAHVYALSDGIQVAELGHNGITDLAFDPKGRFAATTGADGNIRIWQLPAGGLDATLACGESVVDVEFLPDGKSLIAQKGNSSLSYWRLLECSLDADVDWTLSETEQISRLSARVEQLNREATYAGDVAVCRVTVNNGGIGPTSRLFADVYIESDPDRRYLGTFGIGRVEAGETVVREFRLALPCSLPNDEAELNVVFGEHYGAAPSPQRVTLKAKPLPRQDTPIEILLSDSSTTAVGNGNGKVETGEGIDLLVNLQNLTGAELANVCMELSEVKPLPGVQMHRVEAVLDSVPNQSIGTGRLGFNVLPSASPGVAAFRVKVSDDSGRVLAYPAFEIPIVAKSPVPGSDDAAGVDERNEQESREHGS